MTNPNARANARTRAWTRLRKLTGLPPGTERRAVLEAAADLLETASELLHAGSAVNDREIARLRKHVSRN